MRHSKAAHNNKNYRRGRRKQSVIGHIRPPRRDQRGVDGAKFVVQRGKTPYLEKGHPEKHLRSGEHQQSLNKVRIDHRQVTAHDGIKKDDDAADQHAGEIFRTEDDAQQLAGGGPLCHQVHTHREQDYQRGDHAQRRGVKTFFVILRQRDRAKQLGIFSQAASKKAETHRVARSVSRRPPKHRVPAGIPESRGRRISISAHIRRYQGKRRDPWSDPSPADKKILISIADPHSDYADEAYRRQINKKRNQRPIHKTTSLNSVTV